MNRHILYSLSVCLLLFLCLSASAQNGLNLSGRAKLGYIFIDDDGKTSTTQERFNIYSGFILQDLNLTGLFKKNSSFELNFSNINKGNRSLFFSLRNPGLFSFSSRLNQSRLVFDEEGNVESKRISSSVSGHVQPTEFLRLKADFSHYRKKGDRKGDYESLGIDGGEYDQFFWSAGLGGQLKFKKRFLDFEYRLRSLDDRKNDLLDREGSRIRTSLNTPLPQNVYLSLQYLHDENELKESDLELKSDLYTASILHQLTKQIDLSAKFLLQRTENQSTQITSEVLRGGAQVSYRFYRGCGFNLGYEYEKREDDAKGSADETNVTFNSYLVGAYAKVMPELSAKVRYVFQNRKDEDKTTLTGPYDDERILVQVKSRPFKQINLKLRYEDKRRDNPDISSSICDKGMVTDIAISVKEWLGFHFNYSLLDVKYDNTEGKFETDNSAFTSRISLKPLKKVDLIAGWNHIDIRGDLDIRKEGVSFGFSYLFMEGYALEGEYDAYGYDDYLNYSDYYAANVYTVSLVRKFGGI
jgi:hypothetical protein